MKQERNKVYVLVNADHNPDGTCRPRFITLEDGRKFEIDRLIHRCRAAATKVGGTGMVRVSVIRYLSAESKPTFLMKKTANGL